MMFFIGFISGIFIYGIFSIIFSKIRRNKNSLPLRRGIVWREYVSTNALGKEDIHVQFEVSELESTDTLTKVKVLSLKTNSSSQNNDQSSIKKLKAMIDNSWIETKDIKWITTEADIRMIKLIKY